MLLLIEFGSLYIRWVRINSLEGLRDGAPEENLITFLELSRHKWKENLIKKINSLWALWPSPLSVLRKSSPLPPHKAASVLHQEEKPDAGRVWMAASHERSTWLAGLFRSLPNRNYVTRRFQTGSFLIKVQMLGRLSHKTEGSVLRRQRLFGIQQEISSMKLAEEYPDGSLSRGQMLLRGEVASSFCVWFLLVVFFGFTHRADLIDTESFWFLHAGF